mmetsp:Transcript_4907/g.17798  ORF Transcript_4907/g.17798 Transcript_4907/m.17798 type:complete len:215 (+) Transcript_4907:2953-3597(+)
MGVLFASESSTALMQSSTPEYCATSVTPQFTSTPCPGGTTSSERLNAMITLPLLLAVNPLIGVETNSKATFSPEVDLMSIWKPAMATLVAYSMSKRPSPVTVVNNSCEDAGGGDGGGVGGGIVDGGDGKQDGYETGRAAGFALTSDTMTFNMHSSAPALLPTSDTLMVARTPSPAGIGVAVRLKPITVSLGPAFAVIPGTVLTAPERVCASGPM